MPTRDPGLSFLKGKVLSRNATMSCLETLAYDLRYAFAQDLLEGRGFQIVEVNGVSSEATSIYDPKNSVRNAYQTVFRQWEIIFAIADETRRGGCGPPRRESCLAQYDR
jgi:hypothetical protein